MRIFIYELVSAGGLGNEPPPSLRHEGWAMLAAVVADFERAKGIEVLTLLDETRPQTLGGECRRCRAGDEPAVFREVARSADHALIIAPETDDLLATRSQWALDAGASLLGCQPEAVRRVADKLSLPRTLTAAGIPAIATLPLPDMPVDVDIPFPRVLKPRIGAGAQATWLANDAMSWDAAVRAARAELPRSDFIAQPYHAGTPASMAVLCGKEAVVTTPGAFQRLRVDGRLTYEGGSAPLPPALRQRAERLARQVVSATAPLHGYIGIDLILGQAGDGSDDVVVEINPRLTTSYIGLRRLTRANLAAQWLRLLGVHAGTENEAVIEWSQQSTVW